MRGALYLRVSTDRQDADNQRLAIEERNRLERFAEGKAYEIVKTYKDTLSGAVDERPGFEAMLHDANRGRWDVLIFWSWDRLTRRGIGPAFTIMTRLETAGVNWESVNEPFLSSTQPRASRELLLSIVSWVAQLERRTISERTKAGLARAKAQGKHLGRREGSQDRYPRTVWGTCRVCKRQKFIYRRTKRCRKCAIRENRLRLVEKGEPKSVVARSVSR